MKTLITDSPKEAASFVRAGQVAAFPTETVYGLGADAFNEAAVRRIFEAKGRPRDNPLIIHVSSLDELESVAELHSREGKQLIEHFFPGPLTVIFEKTHAVPNGVTAGLSTAGVRMPSHPIAMSFLRACGGPVAAPSANRSGRPSPTTWQAVREDLDGRIPCILRGGRSEVGLESTVVDCSISPPTVLRAGAISVERLREVVSDIRIGSADASESTRSPGMRHRHYAPAARVVIVDRPPNLPESDAAYIGIAPPEDDFQHSLVCTSVDEYARELFEFFRRCDAHGVGTIYCERVDEAGIGLALMDRLRRASLASADG